MFRQVGIGAAAVLSIGLLAAGCSDDGDTIIIGGSGDLNNNDQTSFTTVASNNLAPDGGGLSDNNADVQEFTVTFNCDCCDSDGTFAGDNSAILLFEIQDNATNAFRIYASHYNGSTLTPPVELFGDDRNDNVGVNLQAFVCIPLNTANYQPSSTTAGVAETRANNGNWLILGSAMTLFQDPVLAGAGGNQTTTNARGPRFALYSWRFVLANRAVPTGVVTLNSISENFRYGFEETGDIVNTSFQGGSAANATVPASTANSALAVPANHVTSYGFVSDTLCGQARFGGNSLPFSNDNDGNGATAFAGVGNAPGGTSANLTAFQIAIPWIGSNGGAAAAGQGMLPTAAQFAGYRNAAYRVGEATNYITAVWTQVCNSFSGGGTFNDGQTYAGGHELQLRNRSFNMGTMSWDTNEAEIVPPVERNASTTATRAGTAPFPTFYVSNNFLYFKYADASLNVDAGNTTPDDLLSLIPTQGVGNHDWQQDNTGGHEHGNLFRAGSGRPGFWEEIIAVQQFNDDGDGTSSPASTGAVDLSSDSNTNGGSAGSHTTTNPTVADNTSNAADVYPADREIANFNSTQFILGPDGGNNEYSLFYVMADNSNTTGNINNDMELCVVVHDVNGAFVTGTNPNRISGTSAGDFHGNTLVLNDAVNAGGNTQTLLEDPIVPNGVADGNGGADVRGIVSSYTVGGGSPQYFSLCVNRTGTWAAIAYLKDTGQSSPPTSAPAAGSFHQGLFVVAYQPFRNTAGATGTGTAAAVDARTTAPQEVNLTTGLPTTYTPGQAGFAARTYIQAVADAETSNNWNALPVNRYSWQGKIGYRCGMQSNSDIISIFFEQSDSTQDRVFGRQMTITAGSTGTPTLTFTAAAAELDASDAIASHATFVRAGPSNATVQGATTFRFINRDVTTNFFTCDSGIDAAGAAGQVLVVYEKVVDNTTTDGDLGDREVRLARFNGTTFSASIAIGCQSNENSPVIGLAGNNDETNSGSSENDNVSGNSTAAGDVEALVCVPNNSNITAAPSYPTLAREVDIYIYLTDRETTQTTTGGANTNTTNNSRRIALYSRKWEGTTTGTTPAAETDRLIPNPTGGAQPLQIDHDGGISDDVTTIGTWQNGSSVAVLWEANNQLWLQLTSTGQDYLSLNGISNPSLVTNDSSSDVLGNPAFRVYTCTDSNGDVQNAILLYAKTDRDGGDDRLHARTGNGF